MTSDREFEINGRKFKLNKISAIKQFHLTRRLGPILGKLLENLPKFKAVAEKKELSESERLDQFAALSSPLMDGISKLPDAEAEFVFYGLLSCVDMQQTTQNWMRVSTDTMIMVQDLELPALLQIAGRAFMFNIAGFFSGLPQK
jgi:hypothetical protein